MTSWSVQDAKARFSEMLNRCLAEGPQVVTRRGAKAAILVPVTEWERLAESKRSRKQVLMAIHARGDIPQADFASLTPSMFDFDD